MLSRKRRRLQDGDGSNGSDLVMTTLNREMSLARMRELLSTEQPIVGTSLRQRGQELANIFEAFPDLVWESVEMGDAGWHVIFMTMFDSLFVSMRDRLFNNQLGRYTNYRNSALDFAGEKLLGGRPDSMVAMIRCCPEVFFYRTLHSLGIWAENDVYTRQLQPEIWALHMRTLVDEILLKSPLSSGTNLRVFMASIEASREVVRLVPLASSLTIFAPGSFEDEDWIRADPFRGPGLMEEWCSLAMQQINNAEEEVEEEAIATSPAINRFLFGAGPRPVKMELHAISFSPDWFGLPQGTKNQSRIQKLELSFSLVHEQDLQLAAHFLGEVANMPKLKELCVGIYSGSEVESLNLDPMLKNLRRNESIQKLSVQSHNTISADSLNAFFFEEGRGPEFVIFDPLIFPKDWTPPLDISRDAPIKKLFLQGIDFGQNDAAVPRQFIAEIGKLPHLREFYLSLVGRHDITRALINILGNTSIEVVTLDLEDLVISDVEADKDKICKLLEMNTTLTDFKYDTGHQSLLLLEKINWQSTLNRHSVWMVRNLCTLDNPLEKLVELLGGADENESIIYELLHQSLSIWTS